MERDALEEEVGDGSPESEGAASGPDDGASVGGVTTPVPLMGAAKPSETVGVIDGAGASDGGADSIVVAAGEGATTSWASAGRAGIIIARVNTATERTCGRARPLLRFGTAVRASCA
jgi:hypothetical protein